MNIGRKIISYTFSWTFLFRKKSWPNQRHFFLVKAKKNYFSGTGQISKNMNGFACKNKLFPTRILLQCDDVGKAWWELT